MAELGDTTAKTVGREDFEVRGVRLGDLYRDADGKLWEVIALCTEPTATVQQVQPDRFKWNPPPLDGSGGGHPEPIYERETHVIGCRIWNSRWKAGPLRECEG